MDHESVASLKSKIGVLPPSEVGRYLSPDQLTENNKPLILGDIGSHFYAAASLYPTTPEEGQSTNILVWPKEHDPQHPLQLDDISNEDLWNLSEYSLKLLELYPDSAVTIGISADQRGITGQTRKALGTSIPTFHFHNYVNIGKDIVQSETKNIYRSLREPFPHYVAQLFQQFLQHKGVQFEGFSMLDSENKNKLLDPYVNIGGVVLTEEILPVENVNIAYLADTLSQTHKAYTVFHESLMDTFFANYNDVKSSDWKTPYIPRDLQDIYSRLQDHSFITDGNLVQFLMKAANRIVQSDNDSISADLKLFRSPTYSVGIVKNAQGNLCIAINPHFYAQRAGGLQTVGIEVGERHRHEDQEPYDLIQKRTERAKDADQSIREAIQKHNTEIITVDRNEIIPLEDKQVYILNITSPTFDSETEQVINQEVDRIVADKKAHLPEHTAFYNGPAFFPHRIRKDNSGQFYIEGANYKEEGYFRHVALRDSEHIHTELQRKGITAYAGLAVSVLVEVEFKDGTKKVILTKSAPTEYAPSGTAQMPGGSYQQKSNNLSLPNPSLLAQQELIEEMRLYIDTEQIHPFAYITGTGKTNPTLIYKTTLTEDQYTELSQRDRDTHDQMHIDNDLAHEFVLYSSEDEIPENSTNGAKAVLQVYNHMRQEISAEERT